MKLWFYIFLIPMVCFGQDNVGILDGPISKPLLEDTFATPLSAGSVNGTYSTGRAPGLRTVTDTLNKLSISGGVLTLATGGVDYNNPSLNYSLINRTVGRVLSWSVYFPSSGYGPYFSLRQTPDTSVNDWQYYTGGNTDGNEYFNTKINNVVKENFPVYPYPSARFAREYFVLRSSGIFFFAKPSGYVFPCLMYSSLVGSTNTMYPGMSFYFGATANASFSNVVFPKTLWLPSPIASDSFVRANGALGITDGNGTQEKNGGAGLAWNAPGWVVSGNTAIAGNTVVADGVTSGLVGRWQLDAATGATDLSGNGNNGTGQGGISIGAATDRWGVANRATSGFNGTKYISLGAGTFYSQFTVSIWINPLNYNGYNVAIARGSSGVTLRTYVLYVDKTAHTMQFTSSQGAAPVGVSGVSVVFLSRWSHIVGSYDGTTVKLYVNGVLDGSGVIGGDLNDDSGLNIGRFNDTPTDGFQGSIADARIYSRALSPGEVQKIYLAGATALCTNSTANVVAETSFTGSTSVSGLVLNYDGSTGTNLLTSYFDGNGNVKVDQTVNGNTTNLISGAVTYVANARLLTVSAPGEGQVRVYYNNSFVNSSTGIWPGFTNFTQHGLYSQGSGSFTNFANFARGTEGQYSIIDTLK